MTQDQPQQPETEQEILPTPPTPTAIPTPTPKAPVSQSGKAVQTVVQTVGETWKIVQPVLKEGTVKTLRGTIWVLQGAVNQLEGQPPASTQPLVDTMPSAATLPPDMPAPIPGDGLPSIPIPPPPAMPKPAPPTKPASQLSNALAIARTVTITLWQWWKAAIAKLSSFLPESVKQKLPNNDILSAGIGTILLIFVWLNSSSSPPATAKVPPAISNPAPEIEVSPEVTRLPEITPSPEVTSAPELNASEEANAPTVETLPELTAPEPSQPVAIVPPPPPVLTPEQKLLAGIQNKIAEITKASAEGLIQSVQANFQSKQLTVKISDDWYNFDVAKQDKLAADMWSKGQELDFTKVEITDTAGNLIARSPIVGSNIIVLKRQM